MIKQPKAFYTQVPPSQCKGCNSKDFHLDTTGTRWICLNCSAIYPAILTVSATGEDAIAEASSFLTELVWDDCYVRYYEDGQCGLTVPEIWTSKAFSKLATEVAKRDEVLRRLLPVQQRRVL